MAKADQMAREIERSNPTSSHVAEERVMDYAGPADGGLDEEEKYSPLPPPSPPHSLFLPAYPLMYTNNPTDTAVSSGRTSLPSAARTPTSTPPRRVAPQLLSQP
jgi:hypothetical protein